MENTEVVRDKDGTNKRLSVERIYQKKSQLEHILLRPDTYIGSVEKVTQSMWVFDKEAGNMTQREVTYVPGLYKIFDEILVNAADNKQRDPNMSCIKIDIVPDECKIRIWNDGKGIPVVMHKTENMYVPSMIFGHLLTSSNYDDTQKKVTGGRNGYGAKLCNIFSTKFVVETSSSEFHHAFKQTWSNNMTKTTQAKISDEHRSDYTSITFYPDLSKFKMDSLDQDIVDIFSRRAYDIAAASKGVKVFLNGTKLPIKNFNDYVQLFTKGKTDDNGDVLKVVHEVCGPRWEVAVTLSDKGFQQCSFVNSIATTKGGRHVDHIADQVTAKLIEAVKKKSGKGGVAIKPFQIKTHLWVFVNCLIENPTFDSQTKENMTLQQKSFGSKCQLSDKFVAAVTKCGIIDSIMQWMKFKAQTQMGKKLSSAKTSKLKGVPKLDDANDAGTKNSVDCTLILTEGDSAKTLAVSGLSVVGRDRYGVFPLKGKILNVRDATHKQIMENAEITNIIKIVGLQYKNKYETPESLKALRYGKIMIMTDQDQDGSHIKGLLINFIHHNWPALLKQPFLEQFITPIVKAVKGKEELSFYSLPEFEEWKSNCDNWHTYRVKYYKGLGTSTSKEAKEYFSNMLRHRITFKYDGAEDDNSIGLAFDKKRCDDRKEWLTNWMDERKRRSELGLPELYLYGKNTKRITYNEFINRELILFSTSDCERSIPSMVDGLKPGQRKVLFTCLKRNDKRDVKVAQLAGSVAEMSAYHHGELSLMGTIINLAQNYVGSNNLNVLQPIGQFGTRIHGGKDAASPRYIFTQLGKATKLLFNPLDEPLYQYQYDDNQRIEPTNYVPLIPMVLVNGADGIGTGWSTKVPNYNPREICDNLEAMMEGEEPKPMQPWYKNFKGEIMQETEGRYISYGEVAVIDEQTVEISELPVKTWTQSYKENVLEPMLNGSEKQPVHITDYKEYHTDTTVRFVVKMTPEKLREAEGVGLHKFFKITSGITLTSMVLYDSNQCIRKYDTPEEILKEFYTVRLEWYDKRKQYLEGMMAAESLKLDNQARFIMEKIEGTITIENKPKKELIQMLVRRGYDSDPVKSWKVAQNKLQAIEEQTNEDDEDKEETGPDYNYILGMPLWSLSKEKKEDLLKQKEAKADELAKLRRKTPKDLWKDDLKIFREELEKIEQKEKEDELNVMAGADKTVFGAKGRKGKKFMIKECAPSPHGIRVAPVMEKKAPVKSRKKKEDPLQTKLNFLNDAEDETIKPLAERIGMSPEKFEAKEKQKAKPKPKPKSPAKSPKKNTKKGKKKNPWSDESESEDIVNLDSDSDNPDKIVIPRETGPKRAVSAKKKKYFSDSEDQAMSSDDEFVDNAGVKRKGDDEPEIHSGSDVDVPTTTTTNGNGDKNHDIFDDDSDDDFGLKDTEAAPRPSFDDILEDKPAEPEKPTTTAPAKTAPPKKKTLGPKADQDGKKAEKKKAPAKPKKTTAKSKKLAFNDSESDGEKKTKAKPKKTTAKSKKPAFSDSDSDEDIVPKKKGKRKASSDEDFDLDFETKSPPQRTGGGRARKTVKYTLSDDDDDSMFE